MLVDVQGWQWLDEDWHIDMTGHEDACVDNEGWYYAVDFNWLKHPPAPGSGRFKRVHLSPPCLLPMCALYVDLSIPVHFHGSNDMQWQGVKPSGNLLPLEFCIQRFLMLYCCFFSLASAHMLRDAHSPQVRDYVRRRRWVRTRVRDDNVALAGTALSEVASMSSLPPPLLPLADLLGDSAEVVLLHPLILEISS
jgi:hypothetical protein